MYVVAGYCSINVNPNIGNRLLQNKWNTFYIYFELFKIDNKLESVIQ